MSAGSDTRQSSPSIFNNQVHPSFNRGLLSNHSSPTVSSPISPIVVISLPFSHANAHAHAPHLESTTKGSSRSPSNILTNWINSTERHGYEFNESVLLGYEPDTDWTNGFINKPNSWSEVANCLQSEIEGQRILSRSDEFKDYVDLKYWRRCELALREVIKFYV